MDGVIGVVFDQNAVLILKRCDVPVWVLPGGGIDPGEQPEDAVVREVLEETGFHVEIVRKVAEYTPLIRLAHFTHSFECKIIGGAPTTGPESCKVMLCPLDKLPETFFHVHRDWINDATQQLPLMRKAITQVTYLKLFAYFCRHPIRVLRFYSSKLCHR